MPTARSKTRREPTPLVRLHMPAVSSRSTANLFAFNRQAHRLQPSARRVSYRTPQASSGKAGGSLLQAGAPVPVTNVNLVFPPTPAQCFFTTLAAYSTTCPAATDPYQSYSINAGQPFNEPNEYLEQANLNLQKAFGSKRADGRRRYRIGTSHSKDAQPASHFESVPGRGSATLSRVSVAGKDAVNQRIRSLWRKRL